MPDSQQFDVLFIGAGPGGYVGAIRAAQLGLRTACVEKTPTLGGTCLNVGCIPSKALLDSSEWFAQAREKFAHHGVLCDGVKLDLPVMLGRKDTVVKGLTQGIDGLFKKNKVTRFSGRARLRDAHQVDITNDDGTQQRIDAKAIVIATGSEPIALPTLPFDGTHIVSSTEALSFSAVPQHLVVVGGGAIGLELGSVWLRLGAKVTVVELMPRLIPGTDAQIASALQRSLTKQGFAFLLGAKVTQATVQNGEVAVMIENAAHPPWPEVPTVVVSAKSDIDSFTNAITSGAAAYLTVPLQDAELVDAVRRLARWKAPAPGTGTRRKPRRALLLEVDLEIDGRRRGGRLVDVSAGGCRVETHGRVTRGTEVRLTPRALGTSTGIALGAVVTRTRRDASVQPAVCEVAMRFNATSALLAARIFGVPGAERRQALRAR